MKDMVLIGMLLSLCLVGQGCHKDEQGSTDDKTPSMAPVPSGGQKIVHVDRNDVGPKVMHDGSPAHLVDMRIRAPLSMEGVSLVGEAWQAGGNWNVHQITYRDGGLKFELAFETPKKDAKFPVQSKAKLRWLSGDARPFLRALSYIFQTHMPQAGKDKGKFVGFELSIQTTTGKDVGTMKMEDKGGDWIVAKALVTGKSKAAFRILLLPSKELARIAPLPDQAPDAVLGLFAKALL